MENKLEALLGKIKELEGELLGEMHEKERQFHYKVHDGKVTFTGSIKAAHRKLKQKLTRYFYESKPLSVLTAPVIWFCVVPVVFMDLVAGIYQFICFPVYGIPKVIRGDYIVMDRGHLRYLNSIERLNCVYCGYVNGLLAYVMEIAGRTEQYWCPIKHAMRLKGKHSRYHHFLEYGDAGVYRKRLEAVRQDFDDLKKAKAGAH